MAARSITRRDFLGGTVLPVTAGFAQYDADRVRRWLEAIYSTEPPTPSPHKPVPAEWNSQTITAAWIGHSTVLFNFFGTVILADPVFSDRVGLDIGGWFTLGPKRLVAPALPVEALPPIDLILISHGHMDHCDIASLRKLPHSTPVIMPHGTSSVLDGLKFTHVRELDWGETHEAGNIRVESFPVTHKGSRYPWSGSGSSDNERGPGSNAYVVTGNNVTIVIVGDTAYQDRFRDLRDREIRVDLAVLPIGGYIPHHDNHCTPEEAVMMADHMQARHILPVHWGTFPGEEGPSEPIERLRKAVPEPGRIVIEEIGQTWDYK